MPGFDRDKSVFIKPWGNTSSCMYQAGDYNYPIMIAKCNTLDNAALWTLTPAGDASLYYRIYNGNMTTMALGWDDFFERGYPVKLSAPDNKKHAQYWMREGTDDKTYFQNLGASDTGVNLYLSSFPSKADATLVGLLAKENMTDGDGRFWSIVKVPVPSTTSTTSTTPEFVPASDASGPSGRTIAVAVAIPVVILLVVGAAFCLWRKRRHGKSNGRDPQTGVGKTEQQPNTGEGNMDDNAQEDDTLMEPSMHSRPSPAPETQQPQNPTTLPASSATDSPFPSPFAPGTHGSEYASSQSHIPPQSPASVPTTQALPLSVYDNQPESATRFGDLGPNLSPIAASHAHERFRGM